MPDDALAGQPAHRVERDVASLVVEQRYGGTRFAFPGGRGPGFGPGQAAQSDRGPEQAVVNVRTRQKRHGGNSGRDHRHRPEQELPNQRVPRRPIAVRNQEFRVSDDDGCAALVWRPSRNVIVRGNERDRRDEPVPPSRKGLDESWRGRRVAKGVPDFVDDHVHADVEVDERVVGPECGAQGFARDQLARMFQQQEEDLPRLILQPDAMPSVPEVARLDVELENAKSDEARRPRRIGSCRWEPMVNEKGPSRHTGRAASLSVGPTH